MAGLILSIGAIVIFVTTVVLVCFTTVLGFRCAGKVMNPNRPARSRLTHGAAAVASFLGVFVAAGAGFFGITALLYHLAG